MPDEVAMKASNPVSAEHAAKFAGYVANWCEQLSLGDWRVNVSDGRATRKVMAEVFKTDLEQRSATIRLGKDWGNHQVSDGELDKLALHEVLHIFLFELLTAAQTKDIDPDTLSSHEHRCINVLERLLTQCP